MEAGPVRQTVPILSTCSRNLNYDTSIILWASTMLVAEATFIKSCQFLLNILVLYFKDTSTKKRLLQVGLTFKICNNKQVRVEANAFRPRKKPLPIDWKKISFDTIGRQGVVEILTSEEQKRFRKFVNKIGRRKLEYNLSIISKKTNYLQNVG